MNEQTDRQSDSLGSLTEPKKKMISCIYIYSILFKAKAMASQVSLDLTGFSVSYNEYFRYSFLCTLNLYLTKICYYRLISIKRRAQPDEESLLEVFRIFDPHNTGTIEEEVFRKIMRSKQSVTDEEIEEMIEGKGEQFLRD